MAIRKIKSGDTLSQIAVEEGVSMDEIVEANDIQDPNVIEAGAELQIPDLDQAEEAAVDPSEPLLEEDDIPDVVSTEDFDLDISGLREQNQALRQDVLDELEPTTLERDLQRSLLDVRERADEIALETKENILDLEKGGIGTMAGFLANKESLSRRDAIQLEALQNEEANLLSRLGLEQDARQIRLATQEQLLNFNTQDQELAFRIQDRLEAQRERQRTREQNLTARQKANLNDMVNLLSGVDPSTMDADTEARLAELARQANIPFSVIRDRLELEYNERIADVTVGEFDETLAGGFFSDAQIQKGAANANMSISEFQQLPRDEANDFVRGIKINARPEDTTLTAEDFIATNFDKGFFTSRTGEMEKAKESAVKEVQQMTDENGNVVVGDITYDANDLISQIQAIPETREEANRMLEIKQQLE